MKSLDKKKELSKCCNAPIEKLNDWGAEYMGCSKCFSAQSLDKKKTKELDKRVKLFIEAWYIRTLECIDMDNGDRVIPPPTKKEWELGVKKDLNKPLPNKEQNWKMK